MRTDKYFLAGDSIPSRRHYPRVETPHEVWVYWNCKGREDTSRVRDLSTGGLFVETEKARMWTRRSGLTFLFRKGKSGPKQLSGM